MLARMMVSAHLSCVFLQVAYRSCHFPIIRPSHQNVEFQFKIIMIIDILSLAALIWKKGRFEPATQTCNILQLLRGFSSDDPLYDYARPHLGDKERRCWRCRNGVGRISRGVSNATGVAVERDLERCERAEPSGRGVDQSIELDAGHFVGAIL